MSWATGVTASWKLICLGDDWPEPANAGSPMRAADAAPQSLASIPRLRLGWIIRRSQVCPTPCVRHASLAEQGFGARSYDRPRRPRHIGDALPPTSLFGNRSPIHQARGLTGTQGQRAAA